MGWMELVAGLAGGGVGAELIRSWRDSRRKKADGLDEKGERVVTEALKIVSRMEQALQLGNVLNGSDPMPEHLRSLGSTLAKQALLIPDQGTRDALLLTCQLFSDEGLIAGFGRAYCDGTYDRQTVAQTITRHARLILSACFRGDPVPDYDEDMFELIPVWIEASEIVDQSQASTS